MNHPSHYESWHGHRKQMMREVASERLARRLRATQRSATPRSTRGIGERIRLYGRVVETISWMFAGARPAKKT